MKQRRSILLLMLLMTAECFSGSTESNDVLWELFGIGRDPLRLGEIAVRGVMWDMEYLARYEKDQATLAELAKSKYFAAMRMVDARKIGQGTALIDHGMGITRVHAAAYTVKTDDDRIILAIADIKWEKDEWTMLVPGWDADAGTMNVVQILKVGDLLDVAELRLRKIENVEPSKRNGEALKTDAWTVGEGVLVVETVADTGEIKLIGYVLGYGRQNPVRLEVNEVDLKKGEMIMPIPPPPSP